MGRLLPRRSTGAGSRQLGRRAIVTYSAMVSGAGIAGLHAPAARQPRDRGAFLFRHALHLRCTRWKASCGATRSRLCRAPNGSRCRLDAVMKGERSTRPRSPSRTLRWPKRRSCSYDLLGLLSRHRSGVRPSRCRDLRRLQSRGARGGATYQCQQARLSALFHRLPWQDRPRGGRAESRGSAREPPRIVCDPAPIPLEEMQRTYDWLKSWGMLEETASLGWRSSTPRCRATHTRQLSRPFASGHHQT